MYYHCQLDLIEKEGKKKKIFQGSYLKNLKDFQVSSPEVCKLLAPMPKHTKLPLQFFVF